MNKKKMGLSGFIAASLLLAALTGCSGVEPVTDTGADTVRSATRTSPTVLSDEPGRTERGELRIIDRPARPTQRVADDGQAGSTAPPLAEGPVSGSFDQVSLPAFINTVFGELLDVPFEIAPEVAARTDVVTLRTGDLDTGEELLGVAREVLGSYGLQVVEGEDLYRIVPNDKLSRERPVLIRSRTAADVPSAMRPVFQVVDLVALEPNIADDLLRTMLGDRVTVRPLGYLGAIMIMGLPEEVENALNMLEVLDQPAFQRSRSARLEPVYWAAPAFAEKLSQFLSFEGYRVTTSPGAPGAIAIVPAERIGAVFIFAPDQALLSIAKAAARELDTPSDQGGGPDVFFFPVQNISAAALATIVSGLQVGGGGAGQAPVAAPPPTTEPVGLVPTGEREAAPTGGKMGAFIVDEGRNMLIFEGRPDEYARLLPILNRLDQPPREVLIEVTIAEVTLDDSSALGVEWLLREAGIAGGAQDLTVGTRGGLGLPSGGLSVRLLKGAEIRLALNALATNSRINILSTPRIVARSGQEASIQVGSEVPVITSQQVSDQQTGGDSNILQSIQYRQTGVLLSVKPIVHSSNRIELTIAQEVSEARENQTSGISSPVILTRNLETSLSLADGTTAVLGGLIQDGETRGETGVPWLKDIPILGNAFKSQSVSKQKTELVVLITPYVIDSVDEGAAISTALTRRVDELRNSPLQTVPLFQ